jgi:hypothetical protein
MNQLNVSATILSWVDTSDENAALQWLPSSAPPGNLTNNCPTLYVGNSTGETIRSLIKSDQLQTMTVVLDAPSSEEPTYTLISHLEGMRKANDTILLYTHSEYLRHFTVLNLVNDVDSPGDGPSIIEENGQSFFVTPCKITTHWADISHNLKGPIMMLTLAEYFARNPLSINLEYVSILGKQPLVLTSLAPSAL